MSDKNKKPHFLDEFENGEYIGNLWGWKFSIIGLIVILTLSLYVGYKFATQDETKEPTHQPIPKNDLNEAK